MRKVNSLFFLLLFVSAVSIAQNTTSLVVKVNDGEGQPIIGAVVTLLQNGNYVSGNAADAKGIVRFTGLESGDYEIKAEYVGKTKILKVTLNQGVNRQTVTIGDQQLKDVVIEVAAKEVISDNYGGSTTLGKDGVQKSNRSLNQAIALQGGSYGGVDGGTPTIRGGRTGGNLTLVDGIPVRGSVAMPPSAYGDVQIYASGVPAEYGDATSGIISITTAGISAESRTSIELIQSFDGYGYSTAELFTTGPIWKVKDTVLSTKDKTVYKAKMGYMLSGTVNYRKDPDPSAIGVWVVNDDAINRVREAPLRPSPLGSGFVSQSFFLDKDDMTLQKVKPNTQTFGFNLNGKFDWAVSDNIKFTLGGRLNNFRGNDYIYTYSLLNADNNSQFTNQTYSGFARLRHSFDSDSSSKIKNAYYMIQFDYTYFQNQRFDPTHQENIFRYGHVGQFDIYQTDYQWQNRTLFDGTDSAQNVFALYQLETPFDTLVRFNPSEYNPTSANYTEQYFDFANNNVRNVSSIVNSGGLINGRTPQNVYSLWSDVGTPYTGYAYASEDQASLQIKLGGSVGKNGAHNLKTGFRYESRVLRSYNLGAANLWNTMRNSVNRHISRQSNLDSAIFVFTDGEYYGVDIHKAEGVFLDTVRFARQEGLAQTSFDRNLRNHLIENGYTDPYGNPINQNTFLNPDAYSPDVFDISWFDANDLLENRTVSYYGYDHTGERLRGRPSLDDYLNNPEERLIAPYNPIYMAWFLQDEVLLDDLSLRVGVRVDRFDANQWVLKDPYSLYPTKTVSEVVEEGQILGADGVPSTIGEEYKVYVDDPFNPTEVVGYRDGNVWFDVEGNRINDPGQISELSNTGGIAPYTYFNNRNEQNETGINADAFEDYRPQWTVMPRVAVSFPISENAMFFANYDILAQRPSTGNIATIDDYYYLDQRSTLTIGNPNLRPEKTISYEVGFQQKVAKNMAIKLNAYYREMRDMIQIVPVRYAYPLDYTSYGNIDFGTVKGLIVGYELVPYRNNKNVTLNANYTLQFAKATGSGSGSQAALVQAGQPNLRTIQPTTTDVRHNFALVADFRYGAGPRYNGPVWNVNVENPETGDTVKMGIPILQNAGANLILNANSGRPYSGQGNPTQAVAIGVAQRSVLDGSINGQRYPWNFRLDLKVDKTFMVPVGFDREEETNKVIPGSGKVVGINAYIWIQNILDTRNVVGVYRYTGLPDDDGWLSSAEGQQVSVANAIRQQSYIDMYSIKANNPSNYSLPRLIRFGVQFQF